MNPVYLLHVLLTGTTAGGQTLTLSGSGFLPQNTLVTVCSEPCVVVGPITATQLECVTPPAPGEFSRIPALLLLLHNSVVPMFCRWGIVHSAG